MRPERRDPAAPAQALLAQGQGAGRRGSTAPPAPCLTSSSCIPSAARRAAPTRASATPSGTATFLILGDTCTRGCRFCSVNQRRAAGRRREGAASHVDPTSRGASPRRPAASGCATSSSRASPATTCPTAAPATSPPRSRPCAAHCPAPRSRSSIPDLGGDEAALRAVLAARPDVLNHNLETVPRLYARGATSGRLRSLAASSSRGRLRGRATRPPAARSRGARPARVRWSRAVSWSGSASGRRSRRGPRRLRRRRRRRGDHRSVPAARRRSVCRWRATSSPHEFATYGKRGAALGLQVVAAPFVRSSYRAGELLASRPGSAAGHARDDAGLVRFALVPLRALVMFDLDYTLLRPGDQFEAPGYVRTGRALRAAARRGALAAGGARRLRRRQERARSASAWSTTTACCAVIAHAIIEGLGGDPPEAVEETAARSWSPGRRAENFGALRRRPAVPGTLRGAGVRVALVSNALGHGLEEIVAHFALDESWRDRVERRDRRVKPAPRMFAALLGLLGVAPPTP